LSLGDRWRVMGRGRSASRPAPPYSQEPSASCRLSNHKKRTRRLRRLYRTHAIPPPIREDRGRSSSKGDRMGYSKILALDLGKFKSVGCVMDTATREHAFETLETSREALEAWVVAHAAAVAAETLVAFEACDAAGWVHDLLAPLGVALTVVNC